MLTKDEAFALCQELNIDLLKVAAEFQNKRRIPNVLLHSMMETFADNFIMFCMTEHPSVDTEAILNQISTANTLKHDLTKRWQRLGDYEFGADRNDGAAAHLPIAEKAASETG
jgi:hypothetical protein